MNLGWGRGLGRSRLGEDERGTVLVQFAIYIIAIMGMVGLALDGSRFLLLHNSLQDLADAAALAGAADLDGSTNASNAINDAETYLTNNARWWDVAGVNFQSVHVYATLADVDAGTDTDSNPRKAQFIKVTTGAWQVAPSFLVAVGAVSKNSAQATAVAQASISICKPLPVFLCNPQEPNSFSATPGQLFKFSLTGNSNGLSPGDFNLVDAPTGSGDQDIENYLSQQNGNTCVVSGLNPAQGQKTSATIIGINVRFDQQPNGNNSGLDQTPAPVKIDGNAYPVDNKGKVNCKGKLTDVSATSVPLPSDTFNSPVGSTSSSNGAPSQASLSAYWTNHHPGTLPAGITTRYQIYSLEVAGTGNAGVWLTDGTEPHGPSCAPVGAGDVSRRIESVAVVDCQFWNVHGNSVNNIPINTYLDFFLTQPSDGNIYAEYVQTRSIGAGNATGLHLIVQLVR